MGSCEELIQQLHSGLPSEQHEAVTALSVLPLTPRSWLSAVGAIPRIVQLRHSTPEIAVPQALAIQQLLRHIADASEAYLEGHEAAPGSIIPPLVSLLKWHREDAYVCHVAVLALSALAVNAGNQQKIIAAGAVAPLIQLLKSSSGDLQLLAASALPFLAEDPLVARTLAAGAIGPLLQLFGSGAVAVQLAAVKVVRIIVCDNTSVIAAAGAIPLLVKLLKSSSAGVQGEAAQSLGYLACDADTIPQIVSAGAIPLLVGLLMISGPSAESLRQDAALALGTMSLLAQPEIISAGAIEPLVSLLHSNSEETQLAASLALANLSQFNEAAQARIAAAGAIAPLVSALLQAGSSEELQAHAVMVLANLASNDAQLLVKAGGAIPILVKPLVRLLTSEEAHGHAYRTLLHLSSTPTCPEHFVAAGAIPPLVHLLRSESALVQLRAVTLLGLLAAKGGSDICGAVKSAGALPLLSSLKTAANSEATRHSAGKLLQALTKGTSPFDEGGEGSPCALPSAAASVRPETAAGSSSAAAAALPHAAASPQQQQQQPPRSRKSCWSCGATGVPLKKCSGCAVVVYCGAGCQKSDWGAHKGQCLGLKVGAATGGGS